jgi:hypothetical protein
MHNIPYVMPFLQGTLLNSKLDELIVTVILCNAIQLMEATKLIDYIYMQNIFYENKSMPSRKKNVMISEIAPIHIHLTIRIHSHCESDLIGSDSH